MVLAECLLILGMHRSGTSALAGALHSLGVDFGDDLMPPRPGDNAQGYFEDLEIFGVHERLLDRLGFSWDDPRPLDLGKTPRAAMDPSRAELIRLLGDRFVGRPMWAVKDPRLCLLAPWWRENLAELKVAPAFVIVYRHPAEVAASLAARNGFSAEKSACLWLRHNLAAEAGTRGQPRAFLSYEELLAHPVEALTAVGETLGVTWPGAPGEAAEALHEFLEPQLRTHTASSLGDSDWGRFAPWIEALFAHLKSVRGNDASGLEAGTDLIREGMATEPGALDPVWIEHVSQGTAALRGEVGQLTAKLDSLADDAEKRFAGLQDWVIGQEHERTVDRSTVAALEEKLDERARWLRAQGDQIKALVEALGLAQEQLDERTRWLQIQSERIEELHRQVETLKGANPARDEPTEE